MRNLHLEQNPPFLLTRGLDSPGLGKVEIHHPRSSQIIMHASVNDNMLMA